MKKPTANCKHAQFVCRTKWFYFASELTDGCWLCGEPLTPCQKVPQTDLLKSIHMSEPEQQRCREHPEEFQWMLDAINQPEWYCEACMKKRTGEVDKDGARRRGVPVEEVFAELGDREKLIQRCRQDIAEVEACVPDCPYRVKLEGWRKGLEREQRGAHHPDVPSETRQVP